MKTMSWFLFGAGLGRFWISAPASTGRDVGILMMVIGAGMLIRFVRRGQSVLS
jgi:hypothetical protein